MAICIVLGSCNNEPKTNIKEKYLEKTSFITELSDSSFFSSITCMIEDDNLIYVGDQYRSNILTMDDDLKLINVMGEAGRGPSNILSTCCFTISGDTLIIDDEGNYRFQFFTKKGDYIGSVLKKPEMHLHLGSDRFAYNNVKLFYSSINPDYSVSEINTNIGEVVNRLSPVIDFGSNRRNTVRNKRNIFLAKEGIIVTSDNIPIIEKYDMSGTLLEKYDLTQIEEIKTTIDFINDQNYPENSYFRSFYDSYLYGNTLYILLSYKDSDSISSWNVNKIYAFDIKKEIKPLIKYILPGKLYGVFCVNKDYIYAFNSKDISIEKFKL